MLVCCLVLFVVLISVCLCLGNIIIHNNENKVGLILYRVEKLRDKLLEEKVWVFFIVIVL